MANLVNNIRLNKTDIQYKQKWTSIISYVNTKSQYKIKMKRKQMVNK